MTASEREYVDGLECPKCGVSWNELMDTPALRRIGFNPRSGTLFQCTACPGTSRVTAAEIETGKTLSELIENDFEGFEPDREHYENTEQERV